MTEPGAPTTTPPNIPPPAVPIWAVVSSFSAPIALIGGWTLAARLQPPGYSPSRDTISDLAGHGAHHRWVMTTGLVILGVCHIVTALGLRPARPPGRFLLALGGVATLLVAAFPLPVEGTPASHILPAAVSFIVLSVWPLAACVPRAGVTVLGVRASAIATLTMLALLVTFAIHRDDSSQVGLFERILAATQALWPAATVLALLLAGRLMTRSHYLP